MQRLVSLFLDIYPEGRTSWLLFRLGCFASPRKRPFLPFFAGVRCHHTDEWRVSQSGRYHSKCHNWTMHDFLGFFSLLYFWRRRKIISSVASTVKFCYTIVSQSGRYHSKCHNWTMHTQLKFFFYSKQILCGSVDKDLKEGQCWRSRFLWNVIIRFWSTILDW